MRCADIENPDDFSGFQIASWREIASDMGWAPEDWTFTCVDWTAMIDYLVDPDGLCSFAAAGEGREGGALRAPSDLLCLQPAGCRFEAEQLGWALQLCSSAAAGA